MMIAVAAMTMLTAVFGQNTTPAYSFSKTTGTYTELANAIPVNNGQVWDDLVATIPIGFTFRLYDMEIDSVYFGMGFGGLVSGPIDSSFVADYAMIPFETDLIDRGELSGVSQSPIRYTLEGAPGNRIFKLEWKNAGFLGEIGALGTLNDYANFQLWLYEGTHTIEMHYGQIQIANPAISYMGETGAIAGVSDKDLLNSYLLSGSPASPELSDTMAFLHGTPAAGTIYRFSPLTTGYDSDQPEKTSVRIFPNPVRQVATVRLTPKRLHPVEFRLTDLFGRPVITIGAIQAEEFSVDCNDLPAGVYLYQVVEQGQHLAAGKLVVK